MRFENVSSSSDSREETAMSKTKVTPLGFGAVLYEIEADAINFDEWGRVIRQKKSKPVQPRDKKIARRRPRKSARKT